MGVVLTPGEAIEDVGTELEVILGMTIVPLTGVFVA
jgi:hypothetical protein